MADKQPGVTFTATFRKTEGPGFHSHFEITRDGDKVTIQIVNKRGYCQTESEMDAKDFFNVIDKLKG